MNNSEQLRANKNQHKSKNTYSKKDDKAIIQAQREVEKYLQNRFSEYFTEEQGYYTELKESISYETMYKIIKDKHLRKEFDVSFKDRTIKPDGGILYLQNHLKNDFMKVLLIAEAKRQGTNDVRIAEGKKKQAQGNAIERLGKNLIGIRAMMNHESITPFVCFGWGYDFDMEQAGDFVHSKVSMLNEFYFLNRIHIFKRDGDSNRSFFSPTSMFFRGKEWTKDEMFEIMKEIAETSFRYPMH